MTKEEIKDLYSMKDILERYGLPQPNKAGFICCPFHKEKTASMKIYAKDFHCFGCGANGDIFTFAMLTNGLTFKEAFRDLGGDSDNSFSTRLKIYQAQKKRETQQKADKKLQEYREANYLMMDIWRNLLKWAEPMTDTWGEIYKKLQHQEYIWEILNSKNPEECYEAVKWIESGGNSIR